MIYRALGHLTILVSCGTASLIAQSTAIRAIHVLGLEGISNNAAGNLSIREEALRFQKSEALAAQISLRSIQDVSLGFAHKKYDTVTVEYLDANEALHGAIFELEKAQARILRDQLVAGGAHVTGSRD